MFSSSTTEISKRILSNDFQKFTEIQKSGFQAQDILNFISSWPKVPSEYKLHVIADAILTHYKCNQEYSDELSKLLTILNTQNKNAAGHRLGKLISIWLHQRWTSLPCVDLSSEKAYELFPQHALRAPEITLPKEPIYAGYGGTGRYPSKSLDIPLEWEGATHALARVLDHIPEPKRISVIGFGDGNELIALHKKFPNTKIMGFEIEPSRKHKEKIDRLAAEPNISLHYLYIDGKYNRIESYKHNGESVDLVIIRHPNSLGDTDRWHTVAATALHDLSADGTLLMSFYSEKEMRALKNSLVSEDHEDEEFIWSEKVNPYAYNPSFMSKSGTYSFDFMLATMRPKHSSAPDLLAGLSAEKTRKYENSKVDTKDSMKQFVVVKHGTLDVISSPGFYQDVHGKAQYSDPQDCFECKTPTNDYYQALTRISGKNPAYSNVLFCADHVPATKQEWKNKLMQPSSGFANNTLDVHQYFIVGQGISKPYYDYPAAIVSKIRNSAHGLFKRKNILPAVAVTAAAATVIGALIYRSS